MVKKNDSSKLNEKNNSEYNDFSERDRHLLERVDNAIKKLNNLFLL